MDPLLIVAVSATGVALLLIGILVGLFLINRLRTTPEPLNLSPLALPAPTSFSEPEMSKAPQTSWARATDKDGFGEQQPKPFDLDNPPKKVVYQPKSPATKRFCSCHPERLLTPGQEVMLWPVPHTDPQEVEVWCHQGMQF